MNEADPLRLDGPVAEVSDDDQEWIGWAAAGLASRTEEAADRVGLSLTQLRLLSFLAWTSANPSALAVALSVKPPSITRLVDRLVKRGLVERRVDEADRRRVEHVITESGRELLGRAMREIAAEVMTLTDALDAEHELAAREGLHRWYAAIRVHWSELRGDAPTMDSVDAEQR